VLWVIMSVWRVCCCCPALGASPSTGGVGSKYRTANPRGLALGSVSGICGRPVEEEKRARRGVEGRVKCGAQERVEASGVGVNVPRSRRPLAWASFGWSSLLVGWPDLLLLCLFVSRGCVLGDWWYGVGQEGKGRETDGYGRTWTMAFWGTEGATEGIDQGFAGCDDVFVGWERHVGA
jgi:hypothetical protein